MNRTQSSVARVYCVDLAKNKFQVNTDRRRSAQGRHAQPQQVR